MHEVHYNAEDGSHIPSSRDANESIFGSRGKRAATCTIFGNNKTVDRALSTFGKAGSVWATAFEVELNKREVARTDIPVNLASCDTNPKERIDYITALEDMPKSCKIEAIHSHNMRDVNAAFHIHLQCKDDTDDAFNQTLSFLQRVIDNASQVSRRMCSGTSPLTAEVKIKNPEKFEYCVKECTKPSTKRGKQMKMVMF